MGEVTEFGIEEHALVNTDGAITEDAAKQIALAKVGMKEDQVRFTKAHLDTDDGRAVYEIEFKANGMEYEFDIDAGTGAIVEFDADLDDWEQLRQERIIHSRGICSANDPRNHGK